MRFEQLRYVLEVAKTHSVSIAANNLYISQSTISDAIKKLEEELQVALFARTRQGMYLTAAGEKIKERAQAIEDETKKIYQIAAVEQQNKAELLEGRLNIYTTFSLDYNKLLLILSEFQHTYPGVNMRVLEESFWELMHKLQAGIGDIGIVYCGSENELTQLADDLSYQIMSTENFYVLVRKDSKLAHQTSVSIKELTKYPLSIFCFNDVTDDMSGEILQSVLTQGQAVQNTFQTNSIQLLQNHIIAHDTTGFALGETALRNTSLHPELIPIKIADKIKIKMYFVYKKDSPKAKMIQSFWEILQENDFLS